MINVTCKDLAKHEWRRVSVAKARKAYDEGHDVVMCPARIIPFNPFYPAYSTTSRYWNDCDFDTAAARVNAYTHFDAHDGRYLAYYVRADRLDGPSPLAAIEGRRTLADRWALLDSGQRYYARRLVDIWKYPVWAAIQAALFAYSYKLGSIWDNNHDYERDHGAHAAAMRGTF